MSIGGVVENRFVTVGDHKIRYVEKGEGAPVVMLHGLGFNASADQWALTMDELADTYRTIALDMVGWGLSSRPIDGYSFPLMISTLRGFLDALSIDRAGLVGHTLGGWTSALLALESPERVNKLILANTAGLNLHAPSNAAGFKLLTRDETRRSLERTFGGPDRVSDEMVDGEYARQQGDGVESAYISVLNFVNDPEIRSQWSLESRLGQLTCPVLVVWGSDDPVLGSSLGERAAALARDGRLVLIENGEHIPPARKPVEFSSAVREFLAE